MKYVRTTPVEADPMTRAEYNSFRGFGAHPNDVLDQKGFLVRVENGKSMWIDAESFSLNYSPMEK